MVTPTEFHVNLSGVASESSIPMSLRATAHEWCCKACGQTGRGSGAGDLGHGIQYFVPPLRGSPIQIFCGSTARYQHLIFKSRIHFTK
jgi:hypothetical protein